MDHWGSLAGIAEIFAESVPPGAAVSGARQQFLPARTWVQLGDRDGTEIWLDADANIPVLVRTVRAVPEERAPAGGPIG